MAKNFPLFLDFEESFALVIVFSFFFFFQILEFYVYIESLETDVTDKLEIRQIFYHYSFFNFKEFFLPNFSLSTGKIIGVSLLLEVSVERK